MTDRSYVLISPCRNEAAYMRRTLDSVVAQTEVPALWVIVDDGFVVGMRALPGTRTTDTPCMRRWNRWRS